MAASATVEDIRVDPADDPKKPNQDQEEYYDEDQVSSFEAQKMASLNA